MAVTGLAREWGEGGDGRGMRGGAGWGRELAGHGKGLRIIYGALAHYFFFYGSILILRSKNLTEKFTDICSDTKDKFVFSNIFFY